MEKTKKHRTVRLKEKDINLFDFISKFGFATVEQINSYLGGSLNSLKTRLSHLVNDGYLINHRIFYEKPSVYTVTQKACSEHLSIVKQISVGKYEHDLLVIDVFLKLKNRFTQYYTERMIRSERGIGIGKKGRIPDLKGITHDSKSIAIEVDRTDKSLERLRSVIASYGLNSEVDEVWFICSSKLIFNNIEKVNSSSKIKVFHLKDVLDNKELHYASPKNLQKKTTGSENTKTNNEKLNKEGEEVGRGYEKVKETQKEKKADNTQSPRRVNPYKFDNIDEILKNFLDDNQDVTQNPQKTSKPLQDNNQNLKSEENKEKTLSPIQKDEAKENLKKSRRLFNPFKHLKIK